MRVMRRLVVSLVMLVSASAWSGTALAQSRAGGSAPHEGIAVHGRWTIEVVNPDGGLAARHEFQNALIQNGAAHLARVFAGVENVRPWGVLLGNALPEVEPLCGNGPCFLRADQGTLSVEAPDTGPHAGALVLQGSATVTADGSIVSVATYQVGPDAASTRQITGRLLQSAIAIVDGQTIRVTVVLSFS